jgi:hypothetical protein
VAKALRAYKIENGNVIAYPSIEFKEDEEFCYNYEIEASIVKVVDASKKVELQCVEPKAKTDYAAL